jgi:peroxiredoxin
LCFAIKAYAMWRSLLPFLLYIVLLLTQSCAAQPVLSGQLSVEPDSKWAKRLYLLDPVRWDALGRSYVSTVLDSIDLDDEGHFAVAQLPPQTEGRMLLLAVQRQGERYANRLDNEEVTTSNYFPFIWREGDVIELTGELGRLQASIQIFDPAPEQAAILELRDIRQAAFASSAPSSEHLAEELLEEEDLLRRQQAPLMAFARETDYSLPALLAIRWVSISGNYERIPEFLVEQCEHWQRRNPTEPWVADLCMVGDREQLPILLGDTIPDFDLPLLAGDTVSLHQLLGERLTLLDLWASWCAPCRVQNREYLVPLWDEQQAGGFQVLGYALDASKASWERAIVKDGVDRWPHASDLSGDDAPLLDRLRLQTIPANLLLDPSGRVVAKNLHGEALVSFVRKWLQE